MFNSSEEFLKEFSGALSDLQEQIKDTKDQLFDDVEELKILIKYKFVLMFMFSNLFIYYKNYYYYKKVLKSSIIS